MFIQARSGTTSGSGSSAAVKHTLFPGSCGRIDLPESDKAEMHKSLQNVLRELPNEMVVWPGHGYSGGSTTISKEKKRGLLRRTSEQQWRRQMGD